MEAAKNLREFDGILEIIPEEDKYACIRRKTTQGILRGITDKTHRYHSTAIFTSSSNDIPGVVLKIETERGLGEVAFPREIPLSDRREMVDQEVKYTDRVWSTPEEGTSHDYTLEILTGPFKGQKLEKEASA